MNLVLSEEGFVVKSVEITTLSFVRSLRRVAHEVAVVVVPAVLVVPVGSLLGVEHVKEDVVLLRSIGHLIETLDGISSVVESGGEHESLVSILLAIRKNYLVLVWKVLHNSSTDVSPRRVVDLRADSTRDKVERLKMVMSDTKVSLRNDVLALLRDKRHFPSGIVLLKLNEFGQSSGIVTT